MDILNSFLPKINTVILLVAVSHAHMVAAQAGAEQQDIDQVLEMMKAQGMDPQQTEQMKRMLQGISEAGAQQKNARKNKQRQEFEAAHAGNGIALVKVENKQYELKVTKCDVKDSQNGVFTIQAKQAPGLENGELSVHSDGPKLHRSLNFSMRSTSSAYYNAQNPAYEFDGNSLAWEGVAQTDAGEVPLTLNIRCGEEANYYDKPFHDRPSTADNILTMYMGGEVFKFEAEHCLLNPYRTGNLMVDFEATATGNFRGRPAIVLISKSHGVGPEGSGSGYFHDFDLLLGELSSEQRRLSPLQVRKQLDQVVTAYQQEEHSTLQKKYSKEALNTLPPEKLMEAMNASQAEYERISAQAKAMRYPKAASRGGAISIEERDILFRGPPMQAEDADWSAAFGDLSATPEVFLTCSD